jgi:hypothetical protein
MKPPDEAVWQARVAKGFAQEKRRSAEGMRFARRVSILGLLIVAGLWSHGTPYETAVRVVVAAGALVVMLSAFNARKYALAAVSATLMLLYNPFPRTFSFSTDWQRTLVAASAVPFVVSLAWSTSRMERNDAI